MGQTKPTFLFIPDISGFTDFVNGTEIEHSRHIISELLEVIINSDKLGLSVSEIEGDAILFYKNDVPDYSAIIEQCKQTFIDFHTHIKRYDAERICRCGACESAVNLSLKFIIHSGITEEIKIRDHYKLHGVDVILAHRLLKNNIDRDEYILFTESFDRKSLKELFESNNFSVAGDGSNEYEKIGNVEFTYVGLAQLLNNIPDPEPITLPAAGSVKVKVYINAPFEKIYDNFTNFDKRLEWNDEILAISLKDEKINKRGAVHTCLIGSNILQIESLGRIEKENYIVYGERMEKFRGLRDILTIFTFERSGEATIVKAEISFKVSSFPGKIFKAFVKQMLIKRTEKGLTKLKEISEKSSSHH